MNPYRPWSGSTEHIDGTLSAILRAARLKLPRFLLNPNLGQETTAEEYLAGLEDGLAMLSPYVPVEGPPSRRRCWRGSRPWHRSRSSPSTPIYPFRKRSLIE